MGGRFDFLFFYTTIGPMWMISIESTHKPLQWRLFVVLVSWLP